jgi:hypothetical protein
VESPGMAEVGPPVILSLGIAGYCSVMRPRLRCTDHREVGRPTLMKPTDS